MQIIKGNQCAEFDFGYTGGLGGGFFSSVTINLAKNILTVNMENDELIQDDGIGGTGHPPEFGFNGEILPGCKENGKLDITKPFDISLDSDDINKMRAFKRCFFYDPLLHLHHKPDELVERSMVCNDQPIKYFTNKYGPRIETIEGELIFRDEEGLCDEYNDIEEADNKPGWKKYLENKPIFYRSK